MILTERDNRIINLLQQQDFCFYKDISNNFFPSSATASLRLKKLQRQGLITVEPIYSPHFNKIMDKASMPFIGNNKKVVYLNNKFKIQKRRFSKWKIKHQLLLFSLKERLEKLLNKKALFENDVRDLRETFYSRKWEPLPDLYIQGGGYKLAVELELHIKSKDRYIRKSSDYRKSSFTHVLYFITNIKRMGFFVKFFKSYKYIGMAHYGRVDELICYWYGRLSLLEWLKKRTK